MNYQNDPRYWRERRLIVWASLLSILVLVGIGIFAYQQYEIQKAETARFAEAEGLPHPLGSASDPSRSAEELQRLGAAAHLEKHFEKAIGYFNQALEQGPLAGAFFGRGEAFRQTGKIPEAITDLQRAVELEPENALYSNKLGMVRLSHPSTLEVQPPMELKPAQNPNGRIFVLILSSLRESRFDDTTIHLETAAQLLSPTFFSALLNDPEMLPYQTRPEVSRHLSLSR